MVQQIDLKLRQMRLAGMARGWQALNETKQVFDLSFSEGLEILIEREEEERKNNRFNRMIMGARFRYQASLEELIYEPSRDLNKALITDLASCGYITRGASVLITGATGCGKSFLASGLGHQACLHGYSVIYFNTQKFMLRTKMARSDGSILKYFDKIAKASLLILDDFGLTRWNNNNSLTLWRSLKIDMERHQQSL